MGAGSRQQTLQFCLPEHRFLSEDYSIGVVSPSVNARNWEELWGIARANAASNAVFEGGPFCRAAEWCHLDISVA